MPEQTETRNDGIVITDDGEVILNYGDLGDPSEIPVFKPVPDGKYRVRVVESHFQKNEKTGTLWWKLVVTVINDEQYEGRKIWDDAPMTNAARVFSQKILHALTGDDWRQDGMKFGKPSDYIGSEADVVISSIPHWNAEKAKAGQRVNQIDYWLSPNAHYASNDDNGSVGGDLGIFSEPEVPSDFSNI